jgi:zinc protease
VYYLAGDYEQSHIRMGRLIPGLTEDSPEYPYVQLLGVGLGWGRVFYRSRAEGLSYGAGVDVSAGLDLGEWSGFGSGRGEVTGELLSLLREEVERIGSEPLDAKELEAARTFVLGSEIQDMETPRDVVGGILENICLERPEGYLEAQFEAYRSATVEDLERAAMRSLPLDSLVVVVVGDPAAFLESLTALGWGDPQQLEPIDFGK